MTRRLGLYLGRLPGFDKTGFDRRELVELVREAEACGYESFWMPEAWERDAFSTLAELAVRTERIGLGTAIVNVSSRTPSLIAMSAATIDDISGGRFRLGLGTSGARVIEDFHGVAFTKPVTRLRETIEIIRLLLSGEAADYDGECFRLKRFKLGFKPLRPNIPILLAALSPKSLRLAGRLADGWLPVHWPRALLSDGFAEIKAGAAEVERDIPRFEVAPLINLVISQNGRIPLRAARLPLAYYVGGMGDYYYQSLVRLGFKVEADLIREKWIAGRHREAMMAVTDRLIDQVAVCGTLDQCRSKVDETFRVGATLVLVPMPSEGSVREKCRSLESIIE